MGDGQKGDLRLDFDLRVKVKFLGSKVTTDAGLLVGRFPQAVPGDPAADYQIPVAATAWESGVNRVFGHRLNHSRAKSRLPVDALQASPGREFLLKELQLTPRPFKISIALALLRSRVRTIES